MLTCHFRTAALGSRLSANLAPFAYAGSTIAPFCQQQQQKEIWATKVRSNRSTSSYSTKSDASCTLMTAAGTYQASPLLLKSSQSCSGRPLITIVTRNVGCSIRTNSTSAGSESSKTNDNARLDWNTFFKLRASRRRYSLVSSILASLASTAIGVQVLSTQDLDSLGAQVMGLDPFVVLGLATAACGAIGWLAGPFLGTGLWRLVNRRFQKGVAIVSLCYDTYLTVILLGLC